MGIQQVAPVVLTKSVARTCGCRTADVDCKTGMIWVFVHIYIYIIYIYNIYIYNIYIYNIYIHIMATQGNPHCGLNGHCMVSNCWHLDSEPCPTVSRGFAGKTTLFGIQILHFPLQDPIIVARFSQVIAKPIYIG